MIEIIGDYTRTNADKIREMSDSELAKLLVTPVTFMNGYRVDTIFKCMDLFDCNTREEAELANLEWLQHKVEE